MATDFGKLILDQTPDAVIVTTADGVVVCWTQGACAVFGYGEAEALGRTLAGLIVPPGMEDDERAVRAQTLSQGQANYESMRRARDGALVYIDGSSKAVRAAAGAVEYILWSQKDVTQIKLLQYATLIGELMPLFEAQARHKGLALQFSAPEATVLVRSDHHALQQILANLLKNAIKFTDNGQVRVTLETACLDRRACAVVSVSDTGVGIAPERHAMLFQAFTQLDDGPARQFDGAGLGLHLSQKLAGLLNGHRRFESRPGEGSVFTLVVPPSGPPPRMRARALPPRTHQSMSDA